jgi:hypothetical protein
LGSRRLRGVIAWWPATRFAAALSRRLLTFAGAEASKRDAFGFSRPEIGQKRAVEANL